MRRYLPFSVVAAAGFLTLGTRTMHYRAKRLRVWAVPKNSTAEMAGTETIHARGEAKVPVKLEEFGDFQCPPCGKKLPA
jgi:protein-disulfide isomerase